MPELQAQLPFDPGHCPEPAAPPEIRDEIAGIWGLPIGEKIALTLRGQESLELKGRLELAAAPDLPWDKRQPLRLRVAGVVFKSTEIERWRVA